MLLFFKKKMEITNSNLRSCFLHFLGLPMNIVWEAKPQNSFLLKNVVETFFGLWSQILESLHSKYFFPNWAIDCSLRWEIRKKWVSKVVQKCNVSRNSNNKSCVNNQIFFRWNHLWEHLHNMSKSSRQYNPLLITNTSKHKTYFSLNRIAIRTE